MEHTFTVDTASFVYAFESLPLAHIMAIEEIYYFKKNHIKRNAARFEDVVASGAADFFVRAASYLLLPVGDDGAVKKPDPKVTRRFVEQLTGEQVEHIEECMQDFFTRRKKSDLESDVRSRDFLTLDEYASLVAKLQAQLSAAPSSSDATSSPSTPPSSAPESSTEE